MLSAIIVTLELAIMSHMNIFKVTSPNEDSWGIPVLVPSYVGIFMYFYCRLSVFSQKNAVFCLTEFDLKLFCESWSKTMSTIVIYIDFKRGNNSKIYRIGQRFSNFFRIQNLLVKKTIQNLWSKDRTLVIENQLHPSELFVVVNRSLNVLKFL